MTDPSSFREPASELELPEAERAAEQEIRAFRRDVQRAEQEIRRAVVGQDAAIRQILIAILTRGHVLLEGVPGVGKTLLVRSLAEVLGLGFSRVQCTPDLIPADVTGTNILVENETGSRHMRFQPGPIFASMILADEINRATPKAQSAFLEAMEERQVTVAGESHPLPPPFIVLATQNPIEMEGTFPLPEAQLDRFMFKIKIDYPDRDALRRIAQGTTGPPGPGLSRTLSPERVMSMQEIVRRVPIGSDLLEEAVQVVRATHPTDEAATAEVRRFVRFGASPRAVQALVLGAKANALLLERYHVSTADLAAVLYPALRHRLLLSFDASVSSTGVDPILAEIEKVHLR